MTKILIILLIRIVQCALAIILLAGGIMALLVAVPIAVILGLLWALVSVTGNRFDIPVFPFLLTRTQKRAISNQ